MKTGDSETDLAERALRRRKREDLALVLPILGVLLLASPLLNIFASETTLLGIPTPFLYVFAVWIGGIAVTQILARRLSASDTSQRNDP